MQIALVNCYHHIDGKKNFQNDKGGDDVTSGPLPLQGPTDGIMKKRSSPQLHFEPVNLEVEKKHVEHFERICIPPFQ